MNFQRLIDYMKSGGLPGSQRYTFHGVERKANVDLFMRTPLGGLDGLIERMPHSPGRHAIM